MHYIIDYLNFVLHINVHLPAILQQYGDWVYAVVFLIVFLECGFILTPFLPGESMLFALGAVAAGSGLEIHFIILLLATAAILGGFFNYGLGYFVEKLFLNFKPQFITKHLQRTEEFYKKHGMMAVLLARLVPIVRTFVPFFAGMARMKFSLFSLFNVIGGFIWIGIFCYIGYFFGGLPFVKQHFSWIVLGIITFSIIPIAIEYIKTVRNPKNETSV